MNKINTKQYEDIIECVHIDNREQSRVQYAYEQYSALNPIVTQLEIGDYIFTGKNGLKVIFEYKTGNDLLNSINSENNHLHNQMYEMITNYDYTFLIVESKDLQRDVDELYYSSGVSMSLPQINGAISEYNTVSTVLFTQTRYQAFDLMLRMAGKIIQQKPYRYKYGKKSTNTALNYLSAIKGLDNKANNIVRKYKLHTLEDLLNLTINDLKSVDGIGEATAKKIINHLKG